MARLRMTRRRALIGSAAAVAAGGIITALAIRPRKAATEETITFDALMRDAPAPVMAAVAIPAGAKRLQAFAAPGFDPARGDASGVLERASEWSALSGRPVVVEGVWQLHNPATLSHAGATLIFANAELRVRDDGRWITTHYPKTVPLALYITADRVSLLGHCILTGLATPGKSFLRGIYFEEVKAPRLERVTVRNMAIGVHFMCCDEAYCGFVDGYSMWGLQGEPDKPNGAGSAQVIAGCRKSQFMGLRSLRNDKSARYLSVGRTRDGTQRENDGNVFGYADVVGRTGSAWSHVTGVRSSINSRFAGGSGTEVAFLFVIEKNTTDDAYHIDGNDFGDWSGTIVDSPDSSVDGAIHIFAAAGTVTPVGKNRFGRVHASMRPIDYGLVQRLGIKLPGTFGIFTNSGETQVRAATFDGFMHHVHVETAVLAISHLVSQNMGGQPVRYGAGADLQIGSYTVLTDIAGPNRHNALIIATRRDLAPPPRVWFERIDVRRAMPALRTGYILEDRGSGGHLRIGRVLGQMREGRIRIAGSETEQW